MSRASSFCAWAGLLACRQRTRHAVGPPCGRASSQNLLVCPAAAIAWTGETLREPMPSQARAVARRRFGVEVVAGLRHRRAPVTGSTSRPLTRHRAASTRATSKRSPGNTTCPRDPSHLPEPAVMPLELRERAIQDHYPAGEVGHDLPSQEPAT